MAETKRTETKPSQTPAPCPESLTPHKQPWDNFTVECEAGKLVCSFVPAGAEPDGFMKPFERHFEEYLNLNASVHYDIQEKGKNWVLLYRLKKGSVWIETEEVLKGCATENEAFSTALKRMFELRSLAECGGVSMHANEAGMEFLIGLPDMLEKALTDLIQHSCDRAKLLRADTPLARKRAGAKIDKKSLGVIGMDDNSQIMYPPVESSDLRDAEVDRQVSLLNKQYGIERGGNRNSKYKWSDAARNQLTYHYYRLQPVYQAARAFCKKQRKIMTETNKSLLEPKIEIIDSIMTLAKLAYPDVETEILRYYLHWDEQTVQYQYRGAHQAIEHAARLANPDYKPESLTPRELRKYLLST